MIPLTPANENKHSVKDKILLTAHDLFYSSGFKATGIDKIIKQAKVTKVTFYRYFPSKSDLILAYLHYRHEIWTHWFRGALSSNVHEGKSPVEALTGALNDWFNSPLFRGCAFINATADAESEEVAEEIKHICREHKTETGNIIAAQLTLTDSTLTQHIVMLMDGAIIHAQMGMETNAVLDFFQTGLEKLLPAIHSI